MELDLLHSVHMGNIWRIKNMGEQSCKLRGTYNWWMNYAPKIQIHERWMKRPKTLKAVSFTSEGRERRRKEGLALQARITQEQLTGPIFCPRFALQSSMGLLLLTLYVYLFHSMCHLLPRHREHILGEREKKAWTLQLVNELTVEELFNANDITSKTPESWAEWSLGGPLSPLARGTPIGTNRT